MLGSCFSVTSELTRQHSQCQWAKDNSWGWRVFTSLNSHGAVPSLCGSWSILETYIRRWSWAIGPWPPHSVNWSLLGSSFTLDWWKFLWIPAGVWKWVKGNGHQVVDLWPHTGSVRIPMIPRRSLGTNIWIGLCDLSLTLHKISSYPMYPGRSLETQKWVGSCITDLSLHSGTVRVPRVQTETWTKLRAHGTQICTSGFTLNQCSCGSHQEPGDKWDQEDRLCAWLHTGSVRVSAGPGKIAETAREQENGLSSISAFLWVSQFLHFLAGV